MKQQHYNFRHHSIHRKTPLQISYVNLYHYESSLNNILEGHPQPKMIFAYQGSGSVTIDRQSFSLDQNSILVINSGETACSIKPCHEDGVLSLAMVAFDDIEFIFPHNNNSTCELFQLAEEDFHYLIRQIIHDLDNDSLYYQQACDYYINLLFIYLQRRFGIKYQMITKEKNNRDCELVRKYIDEHYAENITLDILAAHSNMNKYYLVHSFTNNYGCSPINYLNEKKIEESKVLLETTSHSIADIANMIGFSSQSYFSQSFKKHTYMTPNEYRRSTKHR